MEYTITIKPLDHWAGSEYRYKVLVKDPDGKVLYSTRTYDLSNVLELHGDHIARKITDNQADKWIADWLTEKGA